MFLETGISPVDFNADLSRADRLELFLLHFSINLVICQFLPLSSAQHTISENCIACASSKRLEASNSLF